MGGTVVQLEREGQGKEAERDRGKRQREETEGEKERVIAKKKEKTGENAPKRRQISATRKFEIRLLRHHLQY